MMLLNKDGIRRVACYRWKRVCLFFLLFLYPIVSLRAAVPIIGCSEFRREILIHQVGFIIIDVRPPGDFVKGHIQGARNIPAAAVGSAGLPLDGQIVVYCGETSCPLSSSAAQALADLKYRNVRILDGGFNEWLKHGYPSEIGTGDPPQPMPKSMRIDEAAKEIEVNLLLVLDVRPALEFSAGHLPGALNVPLENLDSAIPQLPKDKAVLVYDRLQVRSRQAAQKLMTAGLRVSELLGGLAGWVKKRPLEVK